MQATRNEGASTFLLASRPINQRVIILGGVLLLLLVVVMIVSAAHGAAQIPYADVARLILRGLGFNVAVDVSTSQATIVNQVRLPRIAVGALAGAALAAAGVTLQGTFRNPLADPSIIGVSVGGSLGAVVAISLGLANSGLWVLPIFAFVGAMGAALLVYVLSLANGKSQPATLLLAGVAVNAFLGALISALLLFTNQFPELQAILSWLIGGLRGLGWAHAGAIAGPVLLILYVAFDVLFLSTWLSEHGYTFSGASYKWYKAMKRGDAQEAEYWARRMIRYANPDVHENYPWHPAYAYTHLAAAYELAGKYEAALAVYEDYSRLQDDCFFRWPMPAARIHYKLGDKAKAFLLYCQVARWLQDRRYEVRMYIVGSRPYEKALSPFSSYDDFLQFMFQQWEQTGKAEEYRQTLEFLEAMAHDLSEYDEQWKTAMNTGDAARAKQLAKWLIIRSSDSDFTPYYRPSSRTEAYRRLAAAPFAGLIPRPGRD